MESSKLSFKLFIQDPGAFKLEEIVPVFHSWIQTRAITDHLLIDVADYIHVHDGPSVLLVSHEANYSLDAIGGRPGFTYQRKQAITGDLAMRIKVSYDAIRHAAGLLEQSLDGRVRFRADEFQFRIMDRLHAPNSPETFQSVRPALEAVFPGAALEHKPSPQRLFEVAIKQAQPAAAVR